MGINRMTKRARFKHAYEQFSVLWRTEQRERAEKRLQLEQHAKQLGKDKTLLEQVSPESVKKIASIGRKPGFGVWMRNVERRLKELKVESEVQEAAALRDKLKELSSLDDWDEPTMKIVSGPTSADGVDVVG